MNEQAVLYALSTLAQTCAALAALVGALGLYRLQAINGKREKLELTIRGLLTSSGRIVATAALVLATDDVSKMAREMIQNPQSWEKAVVGKLEETVTKWDACDPDHRRTSRLLGFFVVWNLLVISISLVGFTFVSAMTYSCLGSGGLWVSAGGTFVVTFLMLLEMRESFTKWFGHIPWLEDG